MVVGAANGVYVHQFRAEIVSSDFCNLCIHCHIRVFDTLRILLRRVRGTFLRALLHLDSSLYSPTRCSGEVTYEGHEFP